MLNFFDKTFLCEHNATYEFFIQIFNIMIASYVRNILLWEVILFVPGTAF